MSDSDEEYALFEETERRRKRKHKRQSVVEKRTGSRYWTANEQGREKDLEDKPKRRVHGKESRKESQREVRRENQKGSQGESRRDSLKERRKDRISQRQKGDDFYSLVFGDDSQSNDELQEIEGYEGYERYEGYGREMSMDTDDDIVIGNSKHKHDNSDHQIHPASSSKRKAKDRCPIPKTRESVESKSSSSAESYQLLEESTKSHKKSIQNQVFWVKYPGFHMWPARVTCLSHTYALTRKQTPHTLTHSIASTTLMCTRILRLDPGFFRRTTSTLPESFRQCQEHCISHQSDVPNRLF